MHRIQRLLVVGGTILALGACTDRGDDRVGTGDETDRPDVAAAPRDADDTGRNVRDRDDATLDPMDQSNSAADLDATRQIRAAITADDTMSTDARNIKIITNGGVVTLRGPVEDASEKTTIEVIAQGTPGVTKVDNQLEVAN